MSEIKKCRICDSKAGVGYVGFRRIVACYNCSNVGDAAMTEEEAIEAWNKQNDKECSKSETLD